MEHEKLDRLEEKIDKITDKLSEINTVMIENTNSLIIHEKRTDLAENRLSLLEARYEESRIKETKTLSNIHNQLEPIKKHVSLVNFTIKYVVPTIAAILAFLFNYGILKF